MKYHLLFEQSGTFKNVIKEQGLEAYDYDILNDFGETDYQMDLFKQIELEYDNLMNNKHNETIFEKMNKDEDFIIAFFPCTYFCQANSLIFRLWNGGKKLDFDKKNIKRLIKRNNERAYFFELYMKFCFICKQLGLKTIIENPSASGGGDWLVNYSPIELGYHEKDRTLWGDVYKKPTNFFAINFDMKEKLMLYTKVLTNQTILGSQGMTERSMISKLYAENFYKRFLEELEKNSCKTQNNGV